MCNEDTCKYKQAKLNHNQNYWKTKKQEHIKANENSDSIEKESNDKVL